MAAYITQVETIRTRLLRNAQATGAATASSGQGPMLYSEPWTATLDATNVWATAVTATGTVTRERSTGRGVAQQNCAAGSDTTRLYGRKGCYNPTSITAANRKYQRLVMEFEFSLTNLTNVDNATTFYGLFNEAGTAATTGRGSDDIIGFVLASDVLNTLTDSGATETINVTSGLTLTDVNLLKIVLRNGAVDFYANGTLLFSHTTNIPTGITCLPMFAHIAEAGGATIARIGPTLIYLLDD